MSPAPGASGPGDAGGVLIEARRVVKRYGAFTALDGVSLRVGEGEFVSIVGPNGAGKTTLVNVLSGLTPPTGGEVLFKGRAVAGAGLGRLAVLGMARSFQLMTIFPALTVAETLAVAVVSRRGRGRRLLASLARDAEVRSEVEALARLFGLPDRLGTPGAALAQGRPSCPSSPPRSPRSPASGPGSRWPSPTSTTCRPRPPARTSSSAARSSSPASRRRRGATPPSCAPFGGAA